MRRAPCTHCGVFTWVNLVTRGSKAAGELCEKCFDTVPHDEPASNPANHPATADDSNPWQQNAIRALEGD
jgi:hypothetical protein